MYLRIALLMVVVLGVNACATGPASRPVRERVKLDQPLPESLGSDGLLVATVAAKAIAASVFEQFAFSEADVQVDDVLYRNALHDNYLVLPLKPGEHTLEALHVYRSTEDKSSTRYPLQFKFQIVKGQATNLGLIVLIERKSTEHPDQKGLYWKLLVDNTADMTSYLRTHHPKLAAGLTPATPVLARENKLTEGSLLEAMRRDLARNAWLWTDDPDGAQYVGGEAGTIAKLLRNSQGRVAAIDVLESGTLAAMVSCDGDDKRFLCSSAEPALYFLRDNKIERRALPFAARHMWVHTFPPQGLVLVDPDMNVYSSTDAGASWRKYVWHKPKQPLLTLARIRFENGKNGYYVYSAFTVDPLVPEVIYSDYGRAAYISIPIPRMSSWQRLMETPDGLLIGPQNADAGHDTATLYFKPLAGGDWKGRPLPGKRCFFLQRSAIGGDKLLVSCDGKFYKSTDYGRSWSEDSVAKKQ
jgi:hypothetical protein